MKISALILLLLLNVLYLVYNPVSEERKYEVVLPRKLQTLHKRDTQSSYPDVIQYEIHLDGNPAIIHMEKTEYLIADNYTESHYLEDGTLLTSFPDVQDHCYYQGHVKNDNKSAVIISACNGLRGVIQTRERRFVIEPLMFSDSEEHAVYEDTEMTSKTCGVNSTEKTLPTYISSRASNIEKDDLYNVKKYVKLVLVADQSMFIKYDRSIEAVQNRLFEILNTVNKIYKAINISVALTGIEVWDSGDQIEVVSNIDKLLENFRDWRKTSLLPRKPHDNAQFITNVDFDGVTVGYAYMSVMCQRHSVGITQDHSESALDVGITLAHEIGHNLGMPHDKDDCSCGSNICIMYPRLSHNTVLRFSNCSMTDFRTFIYEGYPKCIEKSPQISQLLAPPVCGNKFVERGEECDCGEPQECTTSSCNPYTCKLKAHCLCDDGPCCDQCKFKPAGSVCRPAKDECDIAEMCYGNSAKCPEDHFMMNGLPCLNGEGACYRGKCPLMKEQCAAIWGPKATVGTDDCFSFNTEGSNVGFCAEDKRKIACQKENVMCGLLYCSDGEEKPNFPGWKVIRGICKTLLFEGELVNTGTKCGDRKVCYNGRCADMEESYRTAECIAKCKENMICDHNLQCQCKENWAPPNCTVKVSPVPTRASSLPSRSCWHLSLALFFLLVSF